MTDHKIADPGPLGLAAFAMTTFCLRSANAGRWPGAGVSAAQSLALFYGGIVQILAGMWEFVRKNTFGSVAFTSYGAFWLSLYALVNSRRPLGQVAQLAYSSWVGPFLQRICALPRSRAPSRCSLCWFCLLQHLYASPLAIGAWLEPTPGR